MRPLGNSKALLFAAGFGPPVVSSYTPAGGPAAGGTTIDVFGTDLDHTTAVAFLSYDNVPIVTPAASFLIVSPTHLQVVSPALPADFFAIRITNPRASTRLEGFATIPLRRWLRAPSPGPITALNPWLSLASGDAYSSTIEEQNNTGVFTTTGSSLNGWSSVRYTTAGASRTATQPVLSSDHTTHVHTGDLSTVSQYSVHGLGNLISAGPASAGGATPYDDPSLMQDQNVRWGLLMTSDRGFSVFHYTGAFPRVDAPMAPGLHKINVRYGGVVGAATVKIEIDSAAPVAAALANIAGGIDPPFSAFPFLGYHTFDAVDANCVFELFDQIFSQVTLTDAQEAHYNAYLSARYGI